MEANEFFEEVNRTMNTDLKPQDFEYRCVDDPTPAPAGATVAEIGPWYQTVTITHLPTGKTRTYRAGHDSTFPMPFIDDWKAGVFN
ncbi:MAG TPA: hypothetical protein VEA80_02050 [Vitreimonas sp.]|uniref:hypothetical protein n=1 Tax=Vitreimonas sp. TaxID=3069702 RepID=UPI002D4BD150|nr:hypothetical protein [Vitreimonas sp.]HYD86233.1 hypothetical protein [Vitreimonas sp.]